MKMKRVLVTGGAGFIGSNLVKTLVDKGIEVDVVDNMLNGHKAFVPAGCNLFIADFVSEDILSKIKTKTYDVVFHLAAIPRVSYSVEHLIDTCRNNIKRFVFASSSSVYGGADILPTPVSSHKNPKSPYALQKSIIEDYLSLYHALYNFDSVSLRFFNVFGPNQLGDSPYATAVSAWLTAIHHGRSMRSDGDGSQSRDMCYVDNVVDACIRAGEVDNELKGVSLNVACGDRNTNKSILEFLLSKYPTAVYHSVSWRSGDVMHTQADISKTNELLGYVPLVRFWEGLELTVKWYEENWPLINSLSLSK